MEIGWYRPPQTLRTGRVSKRERCSMSIDASSSEPLYRQIQQILMQEIRQGRYDSSGRLLSERELAQRFGVSRMTARQAVLGLRQEGWV